MVTTRRLGASIIQYEDDADRHVTSTASSVFSQVDPLQIAVQTAHQTTVNIVLSLLVRYQHIIKVPHQIAAWLCYCSVNNGRYCSDGTLLRKPCEKDFRLEERAFGLYLAH